jgi:esterase/lipase superfamily enzyme
MTPIEISVALSVAANELASLDGDLDHCENHGRDVLENPELARRIQQCIDTVRTISRALEEFTNSRAAADDWTNSDDLRRLRHVAQDVDEFAKRLSSLQKAIAFFSLPREKWGEGRTFIGAQWGIESAVAFSRGDLLVLHRRLRALSKFYAAPDVPIDDEPVGGDVPLADVLAHYDAERLGDVAYAAGPEGYGESQAAAPTPQRLRCNIVPVMFATDRPKVPLSPPLHVDYCDHLEGGTLAYGVAEVSIPRGSRHRVGRLERPAWWKLQFREDPEKHITIVTTEEKDLEMWQAIGRERLADAGEKSALVFIHGFNVTFADAIRRAAQIGWDLQFRGLITAFSWCSEGKILSYLTDERNALLAAPKLLEYFRILRNGIGVDTIHVIAHSMGNQVLLRALRDASPKDGDPMLDEVVLAAPDYDAELFKQSLKDFKGKAKRYTLYGSEKDFALVTAKKLRSGYPRAGDGGSFVLVVDGVETIDATDVGEDLLGLGHSYFASKRTLLTDIFFVIHESLPARRRGLPDRQSGGLTYWAFAP